MFSDITAFGKERWDVLNHNDIIVFLRATSLFLMFSGNASSASINILKFFVFISFFLLATISSPVANTQVSPLHPNMDGPIV
jgi:hypothetical protein